MNETVKIWDFDSWAQRYDTVVSQAKGLYARYWEVLARLVEVARIGPGKLVLDIGTGTGNLARLCVSRGARVVGLDPSKGMLAVAQGKLGGSPQVKLQMVKEPFLKIPYPEGHFDAVVSSYAFHHVPKSDKLQAIREMVRVLKPGGVWALGDLIFADEAAEREALEKFDWLEEEFFAHLDELQAMFSAVKIELSTEQFTPVTWVVWGTWEKRNDALE